MQTLSVSSVITRQRGFSLVEVLVALLILSIGLLGLAGLQTLGLKFNTQSYQRTQAVLSAYDIIDRMRANPVGMNAGVYNAIDIATPPSSPPVDCGVSFCTNANMAAYDVSQWKTTLTSVLSQGRGAVCRGTLDTTLGTCTPVAANTFQVGIDWMENDLAIRMTVEAQL